MEIIHLKHRFPVLSNDDLYFLDSRCSKYDLLGLANAGDSFGEIAILTEGRRTATLLAREDLHLLSLSRQNFRTILGLHYVKEN